MLLFVQVYIYLLQQHRITVNMTWVLLWLNAEPPERVPTPLFGRLIRCSAHPPHIYLLSSCVAILPYSKSLNHPSLAFAVKSVQDSGDINYYINLNIDVSAQNMTSLAPTVPVAPAQLRRLAITVILDVASFPGHGLAFCKLLAEWYCARRVFPHMRGQLGNGKSF